MTILKRLLIFSIIYHLSLPCYAVDYSSYSLLKDRSMQGSPGSEYVSGAQPGAVLMKVNIWGGVGKPGIHHVPAKTNLTNLLSYAGGPTKRAELDDVFINREVGNTRQRIEVDVAKLIRTSSINDLMLEPNDIIVIPEKEPWVSQDTVLLVGVIASLASIVLTGIIIDQRTSN